MSGDSEDDGDGGEMMDDRNNCRPLSEVRLEPGSMPSSKCTRRSADVLRARNDDARRRLDCDDGRVGSGSCNAEAVPEAESDRDRTAAAAAADDAAFSVSRRLGRPRGAVLSTTLSFAL